MATSTYDEKKELVGVGLDTFERLRTTVQSLRLYRQEVFDTSFQREAVHSYYDLEVRVGQSVDNNMTFRVQTNHKNVQMLTGDKDFYHRSEEDQTKILDSLVGNPIDVYLHNSSIVGAEILKEE
ncbi:hypothetical protein HYX12_01765 [Candidatus Woesearchaeota archaeon]|nr:hypothetical protein [Candidatus Woesearchaeota archaeon]